MFTALYLQAFEKDLVAQLVEHLPFKERVLGSSFNRLRSGNRKYVPFV